MDALVLSRAQDQYPPTCIVKDQNWSEGRANRDEEEPTYLPATTLVDQGVFIALGCETRLELVTKRKRSPAKRSSRHYFYHILYLGCESLPQASEISHLLGSTSQ